jgi:hypothetical protein
VSTTDPFRCICDPTDLFDPPDPRPRAVKGCPAHQARYAFQQWLLRNPAPAATDETEDAA